MGVTYLGNIRGPRGEKGDKGLPGAGSVPAAEAMAALAATLVPKSATVTNAAGTFKSAYREYSAPTGPYGPGAGGLAIGAGAAANLVDYTDSSGVRGFIAIGRDALGSSTFGSSCIAIGPWALGKGTPGPHNLAIGAFALTAVNGGDRNIGIGSLAGHFISSGSTNVLVGRDAGHGITTGSGNTGVGYRALAAGWQPIGLSNTIENQYEVTGSNNSALGVDAMRWVSGFDNVAVGRAAGMNMKNAWSNTFIGAMAGFNHGIDVSADNKALVRMTLAATFVQTGNTIVVTANSSGVVAGNHVGITFTSGITYASGGPVERLWLNVNGVTSANTFSLISPNSLSVSGTCVIDTVETAEPAQAGVSITVVGSNSLRDGANVGNNTTVVGADAAFLSTGAGNTVVGSRAAGPLTTGDFNTIIGYNAGRVLVSGASMQTQTNVTVLGQGASVSGSDQVQLGNSSTSTYVYGTVQNRSDLRDKADVRDTVLGLDFVEALRPVDYRWDMREDYRSEDGDTVPDGSQKRTRFHHGFIAQDVQSLVAESGVDFGGLQDHALSGGADVLSIGYDELIAPLVRAVQELSARVRELEGA